MEFLKDSSPTDLTIYTQPGCMNCKALIRYAERNQLNVKVVDVSLNAEALAHIKDLGYRSTPVGETATEHWSGARLDKVKAIAQQSRLKHAS